MGNFFFSDCFGVPGFLKGFPTSPTKIDTGFGRELIEIYRNPWSNFILINI